MANDHLPGNPYAQGDRLRGMHVGNDAATITTAIMALAYEVRTANIQRQAAVVASGPDWTGASEEAYALWEGMERDIGARLGVPDL